jgi:hypothetical protein
MRTWHHPETIFRMLDYEKWRATWESGDAFIDLYLKKYTQRETDEQFRDRKDITYVPAFAQQAVKDVKNAIFHRMVDVVRTGGPESYQQAIKGIRGGVDRLGSTMNSFVGQNVLPELLALKKVGVFIDRMPIDGQLLIQAKGKNPYLYIYRAEHILNWAFDESGDQNEFTSVFLQDCYYDVDESTGLPEREVARYRHIFKENGRVYVQFYADLSTPSTPKILLGIDRIPFVVMDIGQSLLSDIANYQIAMMNMASSDVSYILHANYPFYTEQFDPATQAQHTKKVDPEAPEGTAEAKSEEVQVGTTVGRKYPKGMERPQFISPPTDPLKTSMAKQDQLKAEIRELVNLALSNIAASAESKKEDQRGLEGGLAYIGLVLENGERQIADIWALYENSKTPATISYPARYQLRSEEEIRKEIEQTQKLLKTVPSKIYKKEMTKKLTELTLGHKVSREVLNKIINEIDQAIDVVDDPESLLKDVESGLVSMAYASKLRGYPDDEVNKAKEEHAERLARINEAQAVNDVNKASARGVADLGADPKAGSQEKKESRDNTKEASPKDKTRGKGSALKGD